MAKKFECPKCKKVEARRTRVLFNPDNTKNTQSPGGYMGLVVFLGVVVVTSLPAEFQLAGWIVVGLLAMAITGLIVYRRSRLRGGFEFLCWKCDYFWYEYDPPKGTSE